MPRTTRPGGAQTLRINPKAALKYLRREVHKSVVRTLQLLSAGQYRELTETTDRVRPHLRRLRLAEPLILRDCIPNVARERTRLRALTLAAVALFNCRFDIAEEVCRSVLSVHCRDRDALLLLAQAQRLKADDVGASRTLSQNRVIVPRSPRLWLQQEHALDALLPWVQPEIILNPLVPFELRVQQAEQILASRLLEGSLPLDSAANVGAAYAVLKGLLNVVPSRNKPPHSSVLSKATALSSAARFEEAYSLLEQLLLKRGALAGDILVQLAAAGRATSRYELALAQLAFASSLLEDDAAPATEAAEIHWIMHQYEKAEQAAQQVLRKDPDSLRALRVLNRCSASASAPPQPSPDRFVLSHAAFYADSRGNFGDHALPHAVRQAILLEAQVSGWHPIHVHQYFDETQVELVNRTRGLVLGGGGLFLPDTSPNGSSGWQWNVDAASVRRLRVPLAVFAVGYNLFHGQEFHCRSFQHSLETLVDQAVVFGLRNHGSIERIGERLPVHLGEKLMFVPCPTTVLRHIHPEVGLSMPSKTGIVLFNAAYDRSSRRFGDAYPTFLHEMSSCIKALRTRGVTVRFAAHLPSDERFVSDVRERHGVELDVERLYDLDLDSAYRRYQGVDLVVGMRGHATMIPFGLGTPVLSVASHPKMRYFMDDIGRPEWCLDVSAPSLGSELQEKVLYTLDHLSEIRADIENLQLPLLDAIRKASQTFISALG